MKDALFSRLPLPEAQLDNLRSLGYLEMTAIQQAALPLAFAGRDLIAQAKTGSGKTAAFALPLLDKINPRNFGTQGLILCPTRELATQVAAEVRRLARYQKNIKVLVLCGGQSIGPQIGSLQHGAHIVVGTPGRICDHLRKETLTVAAVGTLVLDEADRMLEMGFIDAIKTIIAETPSDRQTLLFSATYPDDILSLSTQFQRSPAKVRVAALHGPQNIDQRLFMCQPSDRLSGLVRLFRHFSPPAAVVFCNTRQKVREVCDHLGHHGISARALHGDMEQRDRDQVLVQFRQQSCRVLVATDVAARGLDIEDLPVVINYELPRSSEVYVHRIGRTGRAGRAGLALGLVTDSERHKLQAIADSMGRELSFEALEHLSGEGEALTPSPYVTLCIAGGRKNKVRPGDILGALTGDAGIEGKYVGNITVMDQVAYVALAREVSGKALARLRNGKIKGRKFKVRKL